jgi:ABC-type multidrug transport system ATPase subunit
MDFSHVPPVTIKVRDLSLSLERPTPLLQRLRRRRPPIIKDPKRILQNVSLDVPSGSLMAIMGASGSGKTSLLNLMAHRMASGGRMKMEGRVEFNGGSLKDIQHSYVIQQDILLCMFPNGWEADWCA